MKRCTKCRVRKPLKAFYASCDRTDGKQAWCRECTLAYAQTPAGVATRHRYATSDRGRALARKNYARPEVGGKNRQRERTARTGIDDATYSALLILQEGKCGCCGAGFKRKADRDHDYDTLTPRGLLCRACNMVEGIIRKIGVTPLVFAKRLQTYLDNPPVRRLAAT